MATRRLFLAARVAEPTLDGWLRRCTPSSSRTAGSRRSSRATRCPPMPPSTHEVHDLGDVSLLPGFVETHVHMHFPSPLDYREIARPEPGRAAAHPGDGERCAALLLSGRDDRPRHRQPRRRRARDPLGGPRRGRSAGPRLLVAGAPITTTAGHYWFLGAEADTTDEVVRRVRERKKAGVDAVKIMASGGGYTPTSNPRSQQYGLETMRAAVAEAHRLGPAGPGPFADRGQQPDLRRGRRRHDHPRRRVVDRVPGPRPGLRLRPGGRRPDRRARHLGRPDDRRGRAPPRASRRRAAGQAGVRALGAARRPERARTAARVHARHGRARRPLHRRDGDGHADRDLRLGRVQRPGLRPAAGIRAVAGDRDDHRGRGRGARAGRGRSARSGPAWRQTSWRSTAIRSTISASCDAFATSSRAAGSSCATDGQRSDAAPASSSRAARTERRDDRRRRRRRRGSPGRGGGCQPRPRGRRP